jgi:hypothetical protein
MPGPAGFTSDATPSRPYSGPDMTGGNSSRSASFALGQAGDPGNAATSLNQDSKQWNPPAGLRPTSVLQPIMRNPGGNGMSADDAARRLPTGEYMGSVNGTSASSFEPSAMMRLTGHQAL